MARVVWNATWRLELPNGAHSSRDKIVGGEKILSHQLRVHVIIDAQDVSREFGETGSDLAR